MSSGKRLSKAFGLKGTFVYNNELVMAGFDTNKDNVIEKIIDENGKCEAKKDTFKTNFELKHIDNNKENIVMYPHNYKEININNPLKEIKEEDSKWTIGQDYLGMKPKLEEKYFGKVYNDNIHVQIAYNILDIRKILSLYWYNVEYTIASLTRDNLEEDTKDWLGMLSSSSDHKEFIKILNKIKPYLVYYGNIFKASENNDKYACEEHNITVLKTLADFRQFIAHFNNDEIFDLRSNILNPDSLYLIDEFFDDNMLSIKKQFDSNFTKNLHMILQIDNIEDCSNNYKKITQLYKMLFDFSILKSNKNLGVNIKTIRETLIEDNAFGDIMSKSYDTYRSKIYNLIDFYIYRFLLNNSNKLNEYISKLRETIDEDAKIVSYKEIASDVKDHIPCVKIINIIKDNIRGKFKIININTNVINLKRANSLSTFTKYIYFISYFLDNKELNELYSSLINKFENINELVSLYEKVSGHPIEFKTQYQIFSVTNTLRLQDELRLCKSISRIKLDLVKTPKPLFEDALNLLNFTNGDTSDSMKTKLNNTVNDFLAKEKNGFKQKHSLRNFIINNFIKSNRFIYVVKYMNPKKCHKFIENEHICKFVLGQLPDSQLQRYCYSVGCYVDKQHRKNNINNLYEKLKQFKYKSISNYQEFQNKRDNVTIERLKSIANLYLTVIYLIVKSLVKINSLYVIACETLERDYSIILNVDKAGAKFKQDASSALDLLNHMIENGRFKNHDKKYLLENINIYKGLFTKDFKFYNTFRNKILHLNFIFEAASYIDNETKIYSYYQLYHYIVQNYLFNNIYDDNISNKDLWNQYKNYFTTYHKYQKDFQKIIYLPFAYNLARYKKLTIEDLFDIIKAKK